MKRFLAIVFMVFWCTNLLATHNRAGQIIYEHEVGYTYKITVITYTYSLSSADRDSLNVSFGDGSEAEVGRIIKRELPNYYNENIYVTHHTYPGPGVFNIVVEDPNRNEGVLNIPNSVNVIFALKTTLRINPFLGHNSAPILLNRPIDKAAVNQIFIYNSGAYDPDGDSLVFKMDTCRYDDGEKIPVFSLPVASDSIIVNPITGDLVWTTPVLMGIYNVAINIEEWRNNVKISSVIRDIQIEVEETDNNPPEIEDLENLCVIAGEYIEFDVTATDVDSDVVSITASGGPFIFEDSPAQFTDSISGIASVTGTFRWQTDCAHIRAQKYLITFKTFDQNPEVQLNNYSTMYIRVIGPAVQITEIEATNTNVILKWEQSTCENATGYKVYRRNSTENFVIEECVTGMPDEWEYELIKTIENPNQTFYVDDHLPPGFEYCYRIVPIFNGETDGIVSEKQCIEIAKGLPILTKASVDETDTKNGQISVEWLKPINFDTVENKGPYRYLLEISRDLFGIDYSLPIEFEGLLNNSYVDTLINTKDNPSCYRLTLQNYDSLETEWKDIGYSTAASSPFLRIESSNEKNTLIIDENVPWQNDYYVIYRYNELTGVFDSVGTSQTNVYQDKNLKNLQEYCYKVKCVGHYSADSLITLSIENMSQENCGTPIDTIPPCCPKLSVQSMCNDFYNQIYWSMPADSCMEGLKEVQIFYKNTLDADFELLEVLPANKSIFEHYPAFSLSGCYYLSAIDSANNVATCNDNIICVDKCFYYELPNIFTPNSDNINDLYHPLSYKFVESVDFKLYDRWGVLIFETTDPDINWDGKSIQTNKVVSDGVYYYICDVYEYRLSGVEARNISGFIHVYKNKK